MNRLINEHHNELIDLCRQYKVHRLEIFGSATKREPTADIADLDFLVEFENLGRTGYADAYFGLLESLQKLFNKPIDLVQMSAVKNPYFLESIKNNRTVLYGH